LFFTRLDSLCKKKEKGKGAKIRRRFFLGETAVGSWELLGTRLARDHALFLAARQQTKWSGGRGRQSEPLGDVVLARRAASRRREAWKPSIMLGFGRSFQ